MEAFTLDADHSIVIPNNNIYLDGILHIPTESRGIVLFAHGSGSSRFSARNQYVAQILNEAKLATLLFDLLTPEEETLDEHTREHCFNIQLLAARLMTATDWVLQQAIIGQLPLGYFGASTGGGASLVAAANQSNVVKAVVSRGGRPDLAGEALADVKAPTLLIVGGNDEPVIEMNQSAMTKMHCIRKLAIVPGATHLFEERGALDEVARLAEDWFVRYLVS